MRGVSNDLSYVVPCIPPEILVTLFSEYRKHRNCSDPEEAWSLHNIAMDYLAMNVANEQHADSMFGAGWCLKKPQVAQVKNVAGYVGLDMPVVFGRNELLPDLPYTIDHVLEVQKAEAEGKKVKLTMEKPEGISREDQLRQIEEEEKRRRAERAAKGGLSDGRGFAASSFGTFSEEGIQAVMGAAGIGSDAANITEEDIAVENVKVDEEVLDLTIEAAKKKTAGSTQEQ